MPVSPGGRLGPYEVLSSLGAGGMGEVYRARDTRLRRDVAVKVIAADGAPTLDRLHRFEQEAKALAALDDPHILAIHDVGTENGTAYVVFELLEGETLRQRLERGAIPTRKASELAVQMCRGLAVAHARRIIHRDLKPENLFLTRDGRLKILDFGLAKLSETPEREQELQKARAGTTTEPGVLLGTVGYMSPEQARGKPADARSDVFAVGAILYEMLSGRRAFEGATPADLLSAILTLEPPEIAAANGALPVSLERVVRRCLEKDPEERFQSARDVAFAVEALSGPQDRVGPVSKPSSRLSRVVRSSLTPWLLLIAVVLAVALIGTSVLVRGPQPPPSPVIRSRVDLPAELPHNNYPAGRTEIALSPGAEVLAFSASSDGSFEKAMLYRRPLDKEETAVIPGSEGAQQPFFSPDGRWIGYWARDTLWKVPAEGGIPIELAKVDLPMGAEWTRDGRIIFGDLTEGLRWVSAQGGPVQTLTTPDRSREVGHRLPCVLPGGRHVLFTTMPHAYGVRSRVEAVALANGTRKTIIEDAADARYVRTGHLVFMRQGALMAMPFDPKRLEALGSAVPALLGVQQALDSGMDGLNSGAGEFAISQSGLLAYAPGGMVEYPPREPYWIDRQGHTEALVGFDRPMTVGQFSVSPDGRRFAFVERARSGLLWLFDVERQAAMQMSRDGIAGWPRWSPDGRRLAVSWSAAGPGNIWFVPVGTQAPWEQMARSESGQVPSSWSPDGRLLAFVDSKKEGGHDILIYNSENRTVTPFLADSKIDETHAEFSPNGRWLAYVSNETGRAEVYVTSFPARDWKVLVSNDGGSEPAWGPDGRALYYTVGSLGGPRKLMKVDARIGPDLRVGRPETLIESRLSFYFLARGYGLHPDGRRFLFLRAKGGVEDGAAPFVRPVTVTRLSLVHNWFQELERLAPRRD